MKKEISKEKKSAFDPYEFDKTDIGGVTVYSKNFPTAPCIHIQVCMNVGSLRDPKGREGLSHFLEHMIFDGSPTLPTKKAIQEWSKLYALNSWNAWTYFTNTTFHLRCLPEHFETALDGMKDMIFHPLLRAEDVEHERSVITQETWGSFKNEKFLNYCRDMVVNQYHGTARENLASPIGWPETVAKISQEDLAQWHAQNYGVGNFFIVLAGNIDKTHLAEIKKFVADLPRVKNTKLKFGTLLKPKKITVRKTGEEIGDPREQVEISFARAMPQKNAPLDQVRKLAEALLYDILFERLRTERALCYGVHVGSNLQQDFVISTIGIEADEKNEKFIVTEVWKALADIAAGTEKKRFETLKKMNIDKLKSSEEVTARVAENALYDVWQRGNISTTVDLIRAREKVTHAQVAHCLANTYTKDWTVVEIILPSKK